MPQLQISVLPEQLARYGINSADVMRTVEAIGGAIATTVLGGASDASSCRSASGVRAGKSRDDRGAPGERAWWRTVPLGQLARIEEVQGPRTSATRTALASSSSRECAQSGHGVVCQGSPGLFSSGAITLPAGYRVEFGGQFENLERGTKRLMLVVPLSLLLIFLLLFATFNSLRQAALVFTGIPLAIVGGVLALLTRGMPFSISAGVGFIALFGIAVLNGVVLVSYLNEVRARGASLEDAVREGGMTRLRPVLMTAMVASLGFLPMALSHGAGAEVQRPLATVVIGGLITATLLTLLVLPLLYLIIERRAARTSDEADARGGLDD
ncbi:MAG: efflux RND transporter permease subunit [Gemmatimonadetes bacterium]|nr:efflux RND transporter permease subunit [Gemmatimonadota bacterium]